MTLSHYLLDSHCLLWWTLNRQIKKEDLGKFTIYFLLIQKKGSKYDGFTMNYTQQLSKYLSNNDVIMAGKKQFQDLTQHTMA